MTTVALLGSTGLVGSNILTTLCNSNDVTGVYAFTRKELPSHPKTKPILSQDAATWSSSFPKDAQLFISAFGTTRANAGGFENQKKIDYGHNLELAKAAKAAGVKTYVLISTHGASASSMFGYTKMKGELEEAVKALDFEHTVIVRPGLIVGERKQTRLAEGLLRNVAKCVGSISEPYLKDPWAQNAETIAKAAVKAGLDCVEGRETAKVKVLVQADIVRLGRTEWKD